MNVILTILGIMILGMYIGIFISFLVEVGYMLLRIINFIINGRISHKIYTFYDYFIYEDMTTMSMFTAITWILNSILLLIATHLIQNFNWIYCIVFLIITTLATGCYIRFIIKYKDHVVLGLKHRKSEHTS